MSKSVQNSAVNSQATTNSGLLHRSNVLNTSRSLRGIRWLVFAALLGLLSCVCSIYNPWEFWYYINLYGISSLALGIAMYGLYLIFD